MSKIKKHKYFGIVCELTNVKDHPNADRLKIAMALGYEVIVAKTAQEGDVGIVFPEGGQFTKEMGLNNKLYRKHPETGEKMGGFFEQNLRIRPVKLRGVKSEAFFTSLESLSWAGDYTPKVGDEISELNGNLICKRYYNKATRNAMKRAANAYRKPKWLPSFLVPWHKKRTVNKAKYDPCPTFKKHFDTGKVRQNLHAIPEGKVIITLKAHGTSGRTGYVKYEDRGFFGRLLKRPAKYRYVTGTRNVVKNPNTFGKTQDNGWYQGTDFRHDIHKIFEAVGLKKGEICYYEILGWASEHTTIMPDHVISWKDFKEAGFTKDEFAEIQEQYGERFTYHYGNDQGKCSVQVYRIVQDGKDLSWKDMVDRCNQLGVDTVKFVEEIKSPEDPMELMEICRNHAEVDDEGQLREGVVLRFEDSEGKLIKMLKFKSFKFCVAENIKTNEVNLEEIS